MAILNLKTSQKYAVVLAELEFDNVRVDICAPPEQVPSKAWDAEGSIYKQSTVELATSVPDPENELLVEEVK